MNTIRPSSPVSLGLQTLLPEASADPAITGISLDSRTIEPGWLYAALPGERTHGARFADAAVAAGAAAVVTDAAGAEIAGQLSVPVVVLDELRAGIGEVSARLFGNPAERLRTFGVTGTNGKTTTVSLLAAGLAAAGSSVGLVGTIGFRLDGVDLPSGRTTVTTPEAPDLQALLAVMLERGADAAAIEVSSHALDLERVAGIEFEVVSFLNLGHDHLDFHGTAEAYFEAKARLFTPGRARAAVVWTDDEHGREIARRIRAAGAMELVTVGTEAADHILTDVRPHGRIGATATLTRAAGDVEIELSLPGRANMIDAAVALVMLEQAGYVAADVLPGLATAQVAGRMQRAVLDDAAPLIMVDFAHTPQAVAGALEALGKLGPVTTVIGCGGDRDPAKRPEMGRAAAKASDLVVVTDDNPRTEDPGAIRASVLEGAREHGAEIIEVAGRADAIELALRRTKPEGVVAILGKGHERGQIIGDRVVDFDDVTVAQEAWASIGREKV